MYHKPRSITLKDNLLNSICIRYYIQSKCYLKLNAVSYLEKILEYLIRRLFRESEIKNAIVDSP